MKIAKLIEKLEEFDPEDEVVIRTQKRYELYGNIGDIRPVDSDDDDDKGIVIIDFCNEGYSPKQALGLNN